MTEFVEFTYDTVNDQTIEVEGEITGSNIKFKCFHEGKPFSKSNLTQLDLNFIEEEIRQTADEIFSLDDVDYYNEE